MATFAYKARRLDGSAVSGSLPAENEKAALLALDRMGLFPLELGPGGEEAAAANGAVTLSSLLGPRRIRAETASRFARELADLSEAGVPILLGLDTLGTPPEESEQVIWGAKEAKDDGRARTLLREVRREVAQGASLAGALESRPELFGPASISIIRAGETGGFLAQALRRVAVFAERDNALRRRVRGALTYPGLLALLSSAAVVFLLTWVVPRFSLIYEDLGGALPLPTRILIGAGDLFAETWWALLIVVVGGGYALIRYLGTPEGQRARDGLLLRLPLIRRVIALASIARFTRTLSTLLQSGVPILEALRIAKDAAGNLEFTERLGETIAPLREGAQLSQPLRKTRLFPPQSLEMIEVGQESGTLAEVLERVGDRADEEVDHALRIFVTVFEPALIVSVAGVVFFVVLAALLPVFTLNTLIQ